MSLLSNISVTGIVASIKMVLPPLFKKEESGVLHNFLTGLATSFNLNMQQINEFYDKIFITTSTGTALDNNVWDLANMSRKASETDEELIQRYYRYVFEYNCTEEQMSASVYHILGEDPVRMLELSSRSAYWGEANNANASGAIVYYNDVDEFAPYWGDTQANSAFVGYIYLQGRPSTALRNELCNVLDSIRAYGTTVYLAYQDLPLTVYDNSAYVYDDPETLYR